LFLHELLLLIIILLFDLLLLRVGISLLRKLLDLLLLLVLICHISQRLLLLTSKHETMVSLYFWLAVCLLIIPCDIESSHPRLFSIDVPVNLFYYNLRWIILYQLWISIIVVNIVTTLKYLIWIVYSEELLL
jgi:hypothetical protein